MTEVGQVPAGEVRAAPPGEVRAAPPAGASWAGTGSAPYGRRWPAAGPVGTAGVLCALTAVVAVRDPFKDHLTPPCPFHALTGLWCPFCGGARAVWAATHGDLRLMLHANALFPAIVAFVGWSWVAWLGRATGRWKLPVPSERAFTWAAVIVLVAFTVLRNLPGFGALAPPS